MDNSVVQRISAAYQDCTNHNALYAESDPTISLANLQLMYQIMIARNYTTGEAISYVEGICYSRYADFIRIHCRNAFRMVAGLAGMLGSILQILLLSQSDFQTVGFTYHRYIGFFEIFDGLGLLIQAVADTCLLFPYLFRPVWANYVFNFVQTLLVRPTQAATDTLVVYMAFERLVILWLPTKHQYLNKNKVSYGVLTVALLFAAYLLFKQQHDTFGYLNLDKTSWYPTIELIRLNLDLARGWISVILSIGIVIGLIKRAKKQTAAGSNAETTLNVKDLTILCLAGSIPLALGTTCNEYFTLTYTPYDPWYPSFFKFSNINGTFTPPSYSVAYPVIERYGNLYQTTAFFSVCITYFAHMAHFYLNVTFSRGYREGFKSLLFKNEVVHLGSSSSGTTH